MRDLILHKNLFFLCLVLLLSVLFTPDCSAATVRILMQTTPKTQESSEKSIDTENLEPVEKVELPEEVGQSDKVELPEESRTHKISESLIAPEMTDLLESAEEIVNLIFSFSIRLPEITWNLENFSGFMMAYSEIQKKNSSYESINQKKYYVPLPYWTTVLNLQMEDLFWVQTTLCAGASNSFDFQRSFWNLELVNTRTFMEFELIGLKSFLLDRRLRFNPFAGYSYLDYRRNLNATQMENSVEIIDRRYHSLITGAKATYNPYKWLSLEVYLIFSPFGRLVKETIDNNEKIPGVLQLNYGGKLQINAFLFSITLLYSHRNVFELSAEGTPLNTYIRITEYGFQVKLRL